ncbi:MAG TPA: stage III sporulation protein AA [Epulopiscium sp.]|nr:stage III sporulation protein AA [Candidatus Epulonipiscium sp.]
MKRTMSIKETIISALGIRLKTIFNKLVAEEFNLIYEIRIRINQPIIVVKDQQEIFIKSDGTYTKDLKEAIIATLEDINNTLEMMSQYSMYAFEEELRQGYITLEGGHRVGIVGKVIIENQKIKSIRYVGAMNIRVAHEIIGSADKILPYIYKTHDMIYHTLLVSPPRCGKTTILRDLIRQISQGSALKNGMTVGVVDERSEIAGCYKGVPQNSIGPRTDVLDGCTKVDGMLMLLRSMSPDLIAVDEIGKKEDLFAIEEVLNAGVKIVCTVHGSTLKDIMSKPVLKQMIEKHFFERIICISARKGPGTIETILDGGTLEDCKVVS